jgi:hypothetical protein
VTDLNGTIEMRRGVGEGTRPGTVVELRLPVGEGSSEPEDPPVLERPMP